MLLKWLPVKELRTVFIRPY